MSDCRPMTLAPKDGTVIILFFSEDDPISLMEECYWIEGGWHQYEPGRPLHRIPFEPIAWTTDDV